MIPLMAGFCFGVGFASALAGHGLEAAITIFAGVLNMVIHHMPERESE